MVKVYSLSETYLVGRNGSLYDRFARPTHAKVQADSVIH